VFVFLCYHVQHEVKEGNNFRVGQFCFQIGRRQKTALFLRVFARPAESIEPQVVQSFEKKIAYLVDTLGRPC
jgi:hypothetical protein